MATELIINATLPETRIALLENGEIQELLVERDSERGIVGNIYKGKVIRVLPGMQAAFVDIGLEKAAFLYVDDIFFPDMEKPLVGNPLPEPAQQGQKENAGPQGRQSQGGRGGRDRQGRDRGGRKEQVRPGVTKPVLPVAPGTPEEHAMMQREYARRMLDIEDELEPVERRAAEAQPLVEQQPGSTMEPQAEPVAEPQLEAPAPAQESQASPIAAGVDPRQAEAQPEARSPQVDEIDADEDVDEYEGQDEDEEAAGGLVYRPEPLIDAEAWADEVARASRRSDEEAQAEAPAAEGGVPEQSAAVEGPGETVQPETAEAAVEAAPVEQPVEAAPVVQPVAKIPLVTPLATPIPVAPREEQEESDEDEEDSMPRRRRRREHVNIADLVKEGQEILVQVAKDPIGTKGARLTCHVSLPGRYLVFMPTVDHIGVSRRIESEGERRRLKETMGKIRPSRTGVIVRTASGKQQDKNLKADLDYLVSTWNDIQRKFKKQRSPTLVYQDLTIVLRAIRDMFTDEVDKVVVDSRREHRGIMRFVSRFIPSVKSKVELYQGDMPIFDAFGIETEIQRSLERKVWLKSGGYLVVDQAEALVAIDVNTGRYVGKKTLEETILKTNLEAVKEIAYQLRLRNAGGIIILDLIDMEKEANREKVYKALEEALRKDRARPTILKISQLGLVEMTRKRTRDSMVRSLCEPCSYCEGKGYVKNKLTIAYDIMRDIEREGIENQTQAISIQCHPTVADVLLEDKRDVLEALEHHFDKKITIRGNGAYHVEQYELVAHRGEKNVVWSSEERRQLVRQRAQERQQQLAAQARKQEQADREQKKREQREQQAERKRQQQETRDARRKARELEHQARAAARAAEQAARAAAGGEAPLEGVETSLGERARPAVNPDGTPVSPDQLAAQDLAGEELSAEADVAAGMGDETDAEAGAPGEGTEGEQRSRRNRRRGRRGRGRDRNFKQRRSEAYIPAIHGKPTGPMPNVKPVGARVEGAPIPPPSEPIYSDPSGEPNEHLGVEDLSGSSNEAPEGADYDQAGGSDGAPGTAGPGPGPERENERRRRRRGRRGGRFRYRKRPAAGGPGANPQSATGAEASPGGPAPLSASGSRGDDEK